MPPATESDQNSAALKNITIDTGSTKFNTAIEYDTDHERRACSRVKHYINIGAAFSYSYDENGNISSIQNPDGSYVTYTYDSLNQLTSEHYSLPCVKGGGSASADSEGLSYDRVEYSYDTRGNILSKTYSLDNTVVDTITYTYGDTVWADCLTAFDGVAISYDEIGNPLNWTNGETLSWQHGRQLASYSLGDSSISYTYNVDGIRTSKTVNGVETTYNVIDGTLRRMTSGENTLEFINGTSVIFNGTEYWYVFNAQNDVIGLINQNGEYVVEYTYDAWGNILSQTDSDLARLNPFRYRGYIYDEETGFYYVSSRYYDPAVGRWLNSDDVAYLGVRGVSDYNLFTYCGNNPIIRYDNGGQFWFLITAVVEAVYTIAYAVVAVVATYAVYEVATSGNLALELPKISSAEIIPFPTPEPEPESKPEIFVAPSPAPNEDDNRNTPEDVIFYRRAKGRNKDPRDYDNLTPRPWSDDDGLSFLLIPSTSRGNAMTTKAMLENAGFICTVEGIHVSVMPSGGVAALNDWKASYHSAKTDPHELTLLLYSITW